MVLPQQQHTIQGSLQEWNAYGLCLPLNSQSHQSMASQVLWPRVCTQKNLQTVESPGCCMHLMAPVILGFHHSLTHQTLLFLNWSIHLMNDQVPENGHPIQWLASCYPDSPWTGERAFSQNACVPGKQEQTMPGRAQGKLGLGRRLGLTFTEHENRYSVTLCNCHKETKRTKISLQFWVEERKHFQLIS